MNWIQYPIAPEGEKVKLLPLDKSHFEALVEIAKDKRIWQFFTLDGTDKDVLLTRMKGMLLKRATGEQYPFVIIDKATNKIIGATVFLNIFPEHKKLEIGWTWYDPAYWGTGYNTECKLLLLTYCFETLHAVRVQFQVAETNLRSQAAVEKIGGKREGILRKERLMPNGSYRNTVVFSIVDDEWPEVKGNLQNRITATS